MYIYTREVYLTSRKKFDKLHNATRVSLLNNILMLRPDYPALEKKKQIFFRTCHNDIGIFIHLDGARTLQPSSRYDLLFYIVS